MMKQRFLIMATVCLVFTGIVQSQQATQTIRGQVIDNASNSPIAFATVTVLNSAPLVGTSTDDKGNFKLSNIPVGRCDIQVKLMGYEPTIVREVQVNSGKELFLTITLKESLISLNEVTVRPNVNKEQALNTMAIVSARMLSVDEASRYAGGFDDPARLAASFAGVASNVGNNGIVIRGNSPKSLQWKMEGVEIPNPNHFADMSAFGGGGLTALSSKMLANSDFLTAAFPAEYGNALSGVFDIFMRTGNNQKHEHSFQLGAIGIEASSEGPLKVGSKSSYLFNYRYSTMGLVAPLLPDNGGGVRYQDLSFKFNFPTTKAGTFTLWGIGLIDRSGQTEKTDSSQWTYNSDSEKQIVKQYMGAAGISHKYYFGNKIYLKTNLSATVNGLDMQTDKLNKHLQLLPENRINNQSWNLVLSSFVNTKLNARHTNKTGIVLTGLSYDMVLQNANPSFEPLQTIVSENGFSSLVSAYSNSTINISDRFALNVGINTQLFALNNNATVEPRLSFKWQLNSKQSIGLAYGLHSRLERLNYYFTKDPGNQKTLYNKDLDFSKSHHLVLSYDMNIKDYLHAKVETYFQYLYQIPVVADSSFSFINLQNDWFFNQKLTSEGLGRNYGVDLTLEQYLTQGFYFMVTASLFQSEYRGGDNVWRNTRYNRNFLFNGLVGKEWQLGKNKANTLGVNVRLSYQGGDRYSPVDMQSSLTAKDVILDETKAFSCQLPALFTAHFTISYKINKKNSSREIALKVLNATGTKEFNGFQYNYVKQTIDMQKEAIFIPNLSYKIDF